KMSEIVYLNGSFTEAQKAMISPNDRGFIFADGIYEVIKYYNGRPLRMGDHLERLKRSLDEIHIRFDHVQGLESVFLRLLEGNNLSGKHAGIYVQITRGVNKRVHHFPGDIKPTIYAYAFEMPS